MATASLTGRERTFPDDEIIVSKTDRGGRLTYVNDVFLSVSGYTEDEVITRPHSIIRHPEMPRCIFKLLWDTIQAGQEIFAYVNNRAKSGDHYWVFAHVTPTRNLQGDIVGYHSNRRSPRRGALAKVVPLYAALLAIEANAADRAHGLEASLQHLTALLAREGKTYEQFVFDL